MRTSVVILPDQPWVHLRALWRAAEDAGFDTAWTYDHLSWRTLRDGPWLGTVPLMAAAAEATSRIRLGPLVTSPNFRHPAVLAKDAMTIDQISDGRLDLAIGSGGTGFDARALGDAPLTGPERADRFGEFVRALDHLLSKPTGSFRGDWYVALDSRTLPGCVQQPRVPFTIAAAGRRGLRLAAQFGSRWVTYGPAREVGSSREWCDGLALQAAALDAACAAEGRDPASLARMVLVGLDLAWAQSSIDAWQDFTGTVEELGFTDVAVHWPRPAGGLLAGPTSLVFEHICASL